MNKSILLLLLMLIMVVTATHAQSQSDSLKQLLHSAKYDTSRVLLYEALARSYFYTQLDSSFIAAQHGIALAKQLKHLKGEAECIRAMGTALAIQGNYPKSMALLLQALKKHESIGEKHGIGNTLSVIGAVLAAHGDYKQALNYLFRSRAILESLGHERNLLICLVNLGDVYEKLNRLDSARILTQQGYELALSMKRKDVTSIALNNMGNIYTKMNQLVIAKEFYKSSIVMYKEIDDADGICEATLGMATIFQKTGQADSCLYYAKKSLATAYASGFPLRVLQASSFLANYYKNRHQVDSAFAYQTASIVAKDSLFSQEKSIQMQNLSFEEKMRQHEIAAEQSLAAEEQRKNLQYAAIAIGLIVFVILFMLLSRSIIVNEKWVAFFGLLGLLIVFEFITMLIGPLLGKITNHSPVLMLIAFVTIAAMLVPLHHRLEYWITHKMTLKNKRLRLEAAKRIVAKLEDDPELKNTLNIGA